MATAQYTLVRGCLLLVAFCAFVPEQVMAQLEGACEGFDEKLVRTFVSLMWVGGWMDGWMHGPTPARPFVLPSLPDVRSYRSQLRRDDPPTHPPTQPPTHPLILTHPRRRVASGGWTNAHTAASLPFPWCPSALFPSTETPRRYHPRPLPIQITLPPTHPPTYRA